MRVLVTGGTGFVGAHAVAALVRDGHEVRLLVRSPERIAPALGPLGVSGSVDHVVGDVLDRERVVHAAAGCDAAVHAASVYSLDPRRAAEMETVNAPGTAIVLEESVRHGLDPVVHVSSTVALMPGDGSVAGPDSPVGTAETPYSRSKADSERIARGCQERGEPVSIVYPGAVYGADDPNVGEQAQLVRGLLRGRLPLLPSGGFHAVGIQETAAVIRALVDAGGRAERYVVPGDHITPSRLAAEARELTGRRLPGFTVPVELLAGGARLLDRLQRLVPARLPVSREAMAMIAADLRFDSSATTRDLGIRARDFREPLAETIRWLVARGLVSHRQAGELVAGAA